MQCQCNIISLPIALRWMAYPPARTRIGARLNVIKGRYPVLARQSPGWRLPRVCCRRPVPHPWFFG